MIGLFENNQLVTIVHGLDVDKKHPYCKDDKGDWVYINVVRARYVPWELRKNFIDCDGDMAICKTQVYKGRDLEARKLAVL